MEKKLKVKKENKIKYMLCSIVFLALTIMLHVCSFADENVTEGIIKESTPKGAVIIEKVNEENEPLKEAYFLLQKKVYLKDGESAPDNADIGNDNKGDFYWKEFLKGLVSNNNGQIVITDMEFGEYRLVETAAPNGYRLSESPVCFLVAYTGEVAQKNGLYYEASGNVETVTVINYPEKNQSVNRNPIRDIVDSVKTGDNSPVLWLSFLFVMSAAILCIVFIRKKRSIED